MGRTSVAVIYGGRSTEHEISCVSAGGIIGALDPDRYDVIAVGITRDGRWLRQDGDPTRLAIVDGTLPCVTDGTPILLPGDPTVGGLIDPAAPGTTQHVDVVFPILHGPFGEDGTIQGLLELAGLPYVGAGVLASSISMDKEFMKAVLVAAGHTVGPYAVVRDGEDPHQAVAHLTYPLFVKPARGGSSVGITKVSGPEGLDEAVSRARDSDTKVVIEQAIIGREVECAVLAGATGGLEASLPVEIVVSPEHDFYDFDAKYLSSATRFDLPAPIGESATAQIRQAAIDVALSVGIEGLARVDFFLTEAGIVVNELNTMPGFTPVSMFPAMWAATGVDYAALVDRLITDALRRGAGLR